MAVAAETFFEHYLSADALPGIAEARAEVREEAWATVRLREEQLARDQTHEVPLVIDALSTADAVLDAERCYGLGSPEHQQRLDGLVLDCGRLVAEWWRKKRPEYFEPSCHFFEAETGDFYSHGLSVRQITENALRPIDNDPEEVGRRVNERVEDDTPLIVRKLGGFAMQNTGVFKIRTISECTDKAINDFQMDQKAGGPHDGYGGYVPEIEKVMVRDTRLDETTGNRWQEQIGLPGLYVNHFVIQKALCRRNVETRGMDKLALHGTQLIVKDDLMDFVELLDTVASEEWCTNIYLGEEVAPDFVKNYDTVRQEAKVRQEQQVGLAQTTANYIMDLAAEGYDRKRAPAKVEDFVKSLLIDQAKKNPKVAEDMFDEATAHGLKQVVYLESIGRQEQAWNLLKEVEQAAPGGGYCSGGSCGLERVNLNSDEGKDLAKKVKAEPGDKIVKDKERACKCGKKDIIYAYNKNRVNKYCQSCSAFESKVSKVA